MNTDIETKLTGIILKEGAHDSISDGMCAMEAVAWLAGEPHSDAPACACPVVAKFVTRLNDRISDDVTRTELLRPILPKIIGTRAGREAMIKRGFIAADYAVRVFSPMALEARGGMDAAKALRAARIIVDPETALEGAAVAYAVANAAYAAASSAAYAAYAAANYAASAANAACAAASKAVEGEVYNESVRMIEAMIAVTE